MAGILNPDEEVAKKQFEKLENMWKFLVILEDESINDPLAAEFRLKLVWPLWRWLIEIMTVLMEHAFKSVLPSFPFEKYKEYKTRMSRSHPDR